VIALGLPLLIISVEKEISIMGKIASIEYFRVPPRWLFVKIKDEDGNVGWGEASLEGHTQAVEGCLDAWAERYVGFEAEYVLVNFSYL
jgi:galactonate dehydratase